MREEDIQAIDQSLSRWSGHLGLVDSVLIHSPSDEEVRTFRKHFPKASFFKRHEREWDLNDWVGLRCDVIGVANTFMCTRDPVAWFRNVFSSCRWLVLQDIVYGSRAPGRECATETGDVMRYSCGPRFRARIPQAFDLMLLGKRLVDFRPYENGREDWLKFVALIRGDN